MSSHDDGAERAILGACLNATGDDDPAIDALRSCLSGLYLARHRLIARAVLRVANEGPVDAVAIHSVACEIEPQEALWGGASYLTELLLDASPRPALKFHARRILDRAYRRALAQHAEALVEQAGNGASTADVLATVREMAKMDAPWGEILQESLSDLLAESVPPLSWLVDGLWTHPEISILAGDGGVGKTWVGLHVALAIAQGSQVFGRYAVASPRSVAILDLERGRAALSRRLQLVARGIGLSGEAASRVHVLRANLILDNPSDAGKLLDHVRAQGIEWLLVDSMQAAMQGDDCRADQVQSMFRGLYPIRDAGCSVLIIDHVRKLRGDKAMDSTGEALHGSKRKRNAVDSVFGVSKRESDLVWTQDKSNHHEVAQPVKLRVSIEDDRCTVAYSGSVDLASDAVQDALVVVLSSRPEVQRSEILEALPQFSQRSVAYGLGELVRRKIASKTMCGRHAVYSLKEHQEIP